MVNIKTSHGGGANESSQESATGISKEERKRISQTTGGFYLGEGGGKSEDPDSGKLTTQEIEHAQREYLHQQGTRRAIGTKTAEMEAVARQEAQSMEEEEIRQAEERARSTQEHLRAVIAENDPLAEYRERKRAIEDALETGFLPEERARVQLEKLNEYWRDELEADRQQREEQNTASTLIISREVVEREYREKRQTILESTNEGSPLRERLLAQISEERRAQLDGIAPMKNEDQPTVQQKPKLTTKERLASQRAFDEAAMKTRDQWQRETGAYPTVVDPDNLNPTYEEPKDE